MNLKEKILTMLIERKGKHISGESIAKEFGVTRAGVWKAIKQLQEEGYGIEAVNNRGYAITDLNDIISEPGVKRFIKKIYPFVFKVYDSIDSTNLKMKEESYMDEGYVIVANNQTDGRGRFGRNFYSPKNTGIYFSLLLKPNLIASQNFILTAIAAVAVCRAIKKILKRESGIKWVNDVYLDGKKICGILTQGVFSMEDNRAEYIIVGIGLNVYKPEGGFPEEFKSVAGYLADNACDNLKNKLLAEILNEYWKLYKDTDHRDIIKEYKEKSIVIGRDIFVRREERLVPAKALDINEVGNLLVKYDNGKEETLSYGEISIKI